MRLNCKGASMPKEKSLLQEIKKIDVNLDYIRLPQDKTIVEGKPLPQWLEEHAGQKAKDFYLLIRF